MLIRLSCYHHHHHHYHYFCLCLCMYTSRFHRLCTNIKFKCVCVCVHVKPEVDSSHVVTFSGSERLTPGPGLSSASSHSSLPRRDPPSFSAYQQSVRGIRLRYNFLYYLLSGTVLVNCRVLWVLRPLSGCTTESVTHG